MQLGVHAAVIHAAAWYACSSHACCQVYIQPSCLQPVRQASVLHDACCTCSCHTCRLSCIHRSYMSPGTYAAVMSSASHERIDAEWCTCSCHACSSSVCLLPCTPPGFPATGMPSAWCTCTDHACGLVIMHLSSMQLVMRLACHASSTYHKQLVHMSRTVRQAQHYFLAQYTQAAGTTLRSARECCTHMSCQQDVNTCSDQDISI